MTNINVRVNGTANVTQMKDAFGGLQAQVAALNTQLAAMTNLANGVDPSGYQRLAKTAALNDRMFRAGVASTGMFEQQQLKINKATDDYIDKLKRQKLSFREMMKDRNRQVSASAYREQLAMENMVVRQNSAMKMNGKQSLDVMVPKAVSADLNTAGAKMAWFNEQLKSGSREMINWGKNTQWAGRQLMVGFTIPLAAAGAAAGVLAYKMDQEFTRIQKVYDTTADANSSYAADVMAVEKELEQVRAQGMQTAIMSARNYGAAATDTLAVQAELAATGLKGNELQKSTQEVMRISRLGELEYQDATKTTIALQTVFNQNNRELAESFNYINAVENATSLSTQDFAAAIPIAAAPIKAFGGDLQELGVLLTAMKSRGIEATQGANAIKAAMQRLGRPSKQIQEEWKALTDTDITKIFQDSESLTEIFQKIREATAGLSRQDRTKAFAGLFGTYQVTRMSALVEGMDDLNDASTQVGRAMQVANQSTDSWANTADREIKRLNESVSGQFKNALEEAKIQMATLGEPFVVVATKVLQGVNMLIKGFNSLPGPLKVAIAAGLGIAAIAGPLVMLAGLTANLTGNLISMGTGVVGLFTKMEILSTESRAARIAAQLAESGFTSEASSVRLLTQEINKLILAQQQANAISANSYTSAQKRAAQRVGESASDAMLATSGGVVQQERDTRNTQMLGMPGGLSKEAPRQYHSVMGTDLGPNREVQKQNRALAQIERDRLSNQIKMKLAIDDENNARKTSHSLGLATAAATASMAAGMALAFTNSNDTANAIGNMLILGSVIVPAAATLGPLLARGAKSAWAMAAAQAATAKASYGSVGGMKGFAKAGKGALVSISAMMGPIGWTAAAVTAIGVGIFAWQKHIREAREEQTKMHNDVNNLGDAWAKEAGQARKEWDKLTVSVGDAAEATRREQLIKQYSGDDLKPSVNAFKSDDFSNQEREIWLAEHFMELQVKYGLTSKQAADNIMAFLAVAGYGIDKQTEMAQKLLAEYGEITQTNFGEYIANQIEIANSKDFGTDEWNKAAKDVAKAFTVAFNDAATPKQARELVNQYAAAATSGWDDVFKKFDGTKAFEELGINSADALRQGVRDAGGAVDLGAELLTAGMYPEEVDMIVKALEDAESQERKFFGNISKSSTALGGVLGDNVDTLEEFTKNWTVMSQTMNLDQAQQAVRQLGQEVTSQAGMFNALGNIINPNDVANIRNAVQALDPAQAKEFTTAVNAIATAQGIQRGSDAAQTYMNILNGVKIRTDSVTNATKAIADAWEMNGQQAAQLYQGAMAATQQDIADAFNDDLSSRQEAATESRQQYWDNRQKAQDRSFKAQQESLDNKWEKKKDKAEEYWDNRLKSIDNAIKAEEDAEDKRKKMFDAEMARISRLNEMANRNIDFNAALNAGNFDEAAKIRNDANASSSQFALEQANSAMEARSKARVDRLEGRKEGIGDARDAQMKRLDKQEENERKSLDRIQEMRSEALRRSQDADMRALRNSQDREKKSLQDRLKLFLAYTAANEKDLKNHMGKVGLAYDGFGQALMGKGDMWSVHFGDRLKFNIRDAGLKMKSDAVWSELGKSSLEKTLEGMGFKGGMNQFRKFLETGEIPDDPKPKSKKPSSKNPNGKTPGGVAVSTYRHTGGWVDDKKGSRKGVARTQKGLAPSEKLVVAKKKEFMVNEKAAKNNAGLLMDINAGKEFNSASPYGTDTGTGGVGLAGFVAGMANKGITQGVSQALTNAYQAKQAENLAMASGSLFGGIFTAGLAGTYGNRAFSLDQINNAATIASVGASMGMSARDIQIGIMTAIAEAGLVNVNYGDRDSLGLFQQRPSMGWGSPAQVTNPEYASRKFFESLKGVGNRAGMDPWVAAQRVQRSAFADGSNYRKWWAAAQAIFDRGIVKTETGYASTSGGTGTDFVQGSGGRHKPANGRLTQGIHGNNGIDIGVAVGNPVYAVADGTVTGSYDIPGRETRAAHGGLGYRSYGRVIKIDHGGFDTLYAHLSQRFARAGQQVKGGAKIGLSGNTGYSTGPHLHFEAHGASPYSFFNAPGGSGGRGGDSEFGIGGKKAPAKKVVAKAPEKKKVSAKKAATKKPAAKKPAVKKAKKKNARRDPIEYDENFEYPEYSVGDVDSPWFDFFTAEPEEYTGDFTIAQQKGLTEVGVAEQAGGHQYIAPPTVAPKPKGKAKTKAKPKKGAKPKAQAAAKPKGKKNALSLPGGVTPGIPAGGNGRVRTGTYNLAFPRGNAGNLVDLAQMMTFSDILSLQESTPAKENMRAWAAQKGWAWFQKVRGTALLWNAAALNGTGLNTFQISKSGPHNTATYGKFTPRQGGGGPFWQISAHLEPHASGAGRRKEQMGNLSRLVGNLKKGGTPVILSGDFNTPNVGQMGMGAGTQFSTRKGATYDHILSTGATKLDTTKFNTAGSDHDAVFSTFQLPSLSVGGEVKWDNTIANLHRDEKVLTAPLSKKLDAGIDNFANGVGTTYNTINVRAENGQNPEVIATYVMRKLERAEAKRPQSSRGRM